MMRRMTRMMRQEEEKSGISMEKIKLYFYSTENENSQNS